MKKYLTLLTVTCFSLMLYGQGDQEKRRYNATIKSAYHIHDTASVYKSSLYAAELLDKISEEFPNEWLANYWSAYIYTQLSLYPDRPANAGEVVPPNALKNIDIAIDRYKGEDQRVLSNIHSLQAFVYSVHAWYPEYEKEVEQYMDKAREASKLALRYNPDNPMIYVLVGTSKINSDNINDVVAARATLYRARTLFKEIDEHPAFTQHWNENWLRFRWLKYADDRLKALTQE